MTNNLECSTGGEKNNPQLKPKKLSKHVVFFPPLQMIALKYWIRQKTRL